MVSLRTVLLLVGVSFSMLMYYSEAQVLLEVKSSTILGLIGSNQFMSYPRRLCHSFKGCALPPVSLGPDLRHCGDPRRLNQCPLGHYSLDRRERYTNNEI